MSTRGAVWYKREPRAFLEGVRRMSERDIAVYAVILDLIYDSGHQTLNDPKHIASYFSDLGAAGVKRSIDRLVEAGKLSVEGDYLTNKRAKNEGKTREELRKTRRNSGHLGGVSSGKSRSQSSDNNDLGQASASDKSPLDKIEIREERIEPKGSLSETMLSDAHPPRKRNTYSADYEAAWEAYPRTPNMSKAEGYQSWLKLPAEDRALVLPSIPRYRAFLAKQPDHPVIHFTRYLSKRRFDGFTESGAAEVDAQAWASRLEHARKNCIWSTAEWGPMPGQAGCTIPRELLEQGDGEGWAEFKQARSA